MNFVDLRFLGMRRVVGTAVLDGPSGLTLIDPGPTSCLPALEAGLAELGHRLADVKTLLLTHIHLDHAGATGTLLHRLPQAVAYVHERGAPHMIDPAKLLASATRLYGSNMERFWGEFRPVPAERLRVLAGGERLEMAGRTFDVQYTPGHASHHVSYFDMTNGIAYVGDTGGIRVVSGYIKAPTPPPDIDLEAWDHSLDVLDAWSPSALCLTHFGRVDAVPEHLLHMREALARSGERARAHGEEAFIAGFEAEVREAGDDESGERFFQAAPPVQQWLGLERYWRKRAEREAAATA